MLRHYIATTIAWLSAFGLNSLLAILGVAIGCANIIALIAVTDTAQHQTFSILREVGANTIFVLPFAEDKETMRQRSNPFAFLPDAQIAAVKGSENINLVAAILLMPGHIGFGANRQFTLIEGAEPDYPQIRGHGTIKGRFFTPEDETSRARVMTLGFKMVEPLFGTDDPLGKELVVKGEKFTIVGVMREKGMIGFEDMDKRVFIPFSTAQEIYELPGAHFVLATSSEIENVDVAKASVDSALRESLNLAPDEPADFSVNSVDDVTGVLSGALSIFRALMVGVSSVALLVAGISIMNVMLMQVIARTREIGVRRALGARRRDIWTQFVSEAVFQTLVGAVVGVGLGLAASLAFCRIVDWDPHIPASTVVLGVAFSAAVGIAFGFYPAWLAANMKPIDCLRYE